MGNIMMSSAILWRQEPYEIPNNYAAYESSYHCLLNIYAPPEITSTSRSGKNIQAAEIKSEGRELLVGEDGRCDSPGHSAKYGSYSLMDLKQTKIVDSQLVQVCK